MPNYGELVRVFDEARRLVEMSENDFSWSSWRDGEHALTEIDAIRGELLDAKLPINAKVLFLPTGPLQEVSLSSGWGDRLLWLADWFDDALSGKDCECYDTPITQEGNPVGVDDRHGEVSIVTCSRCGRDWLSYRYELEAFSRSGRWFLGPVTQSVSDQVKAENAREVFERLPWYFAGGSYFGSVSKVSGPLAL